MSTLITDAHIDDLESALADFDDAEIDDELRGDLDDEFEVELSDEAKTGHLKAAATLETWATDADSFRLEKGLTVPHVLIVAAEHSALGGDADNAVRLATAAREHSDALPFEAHPMLIEIALDGDDEPTAQALADEVRAGQPTDPMLYSLIGESFELSGDLTAAERWFTMGVQMLERERATDSDMYLDLLINRFITRRDAGLDLDMLDEEALELADFNEVDLRSVID